MSHPQGKGIHYNSPKQGAGPTQDWTSQSSPVTGTGRPRVSEVPRPTRYPAVTTPPPWGQDSSLSRAPHKTSVLTQPSKSQAGAWVTSLAPSICCCGREARLPPHLTWRQVPQCRQNRHRACPTYRTISKWSSSVRAGWHFSLTPLAMAPGNVPRKDWP